MYNLSISEIFVRLLLSIIFSGLIGLERERNNSSAGLKTHILVSMGSTIIALIQIEVISFVANNPEPNVRVDAVRLIAQVVSGIGFLGAGAIMTTKRTIVGLTTAASIWGVSGIGLALGMGFYEISIVGSLLILTVLIVFKRIFVVHGPQQVLVKFFQEKEAEDEIKSLIRSVDKNFEILSIKTEVLKDKLVKTQIYRLKLNKKMQFSDIVKLLSSVDEVLTVEPTEVS
ncbi:MgtC/SapB family protein [Helcococcus sueciensis]|uniref:MgtC/SapB family protein n=1 Tax=Helcococcus sueciensis TaxID=241555 RepID=UPI0006881F48|nr:MgtC/SapB family protein [Helcococcus sueciensis]